MTTKEHLSKHDREIAEIRAVQKRTEANIAKANESLAKTDEILKRHTANYTREAAEIWALMGKLARGTEAAQLETREIRRELRELAWSQKRTEAALRAFVASLRGGNGHRKRNLS
jgi:uncharacterized protein YaaN involved in tellurite resistance